MYKVVGKFLVWWLLGKVLLNLHLILVMVNLKIFPWTVLMFHLYILCVIILYHVLLTYNLGRNWRFGLMFPCMSIDRCFIIMDNYIGSRHHNLFDVTGPRRNESGYEE
jgi:hypothetical protein